MYTRYSLLFMTFLIISCGENQDDGKAGDEHPPAPVAQERQSGGNIQEPEIRLSNKMKKEFPGFTQMENGWKLVSLDSQNTEWDWSEPGDVGPFNTVLLDKLKQSYGSVPYYIVTDGGKLFYVSSAPEKTERYSAEKKPSFKLPGVKWGIANENAELVLPLNYERLYSPDSIAEGFIEIECENNKLGLFGYRSNVVIPCIYDLIFPSEHGEAIAAARTGSEYQYLFSNGRSSAITDKSEIPSYADELLGHKFEEIISKTKHLYGLYGDAPAGTSYIVLPHFLAQSGAFPEAVATGDWEEGPLNSFGYSEKLPKIFDKISALITAFYEQGVEIRGVFGTTEVHLTTVGDTNNIVSNQKIGMKLKYRLLENSLLEIYIYGNVNNIEGETGLLDAFRYYRLMDNGAIEELKSNRSFLSTQYVKMDETYFFMTWTEEVAPMKQGMFKGDGNRLKWSHLNLEHLDIMRNEIFASYGYKFKDPKWQQYFGAKQWYEPKFDDVNDRLTEIDRYNIKLILEVKKKMTESPELYPKPERFWYVAAG
jgi:hypothetical protein